MSLQRLPPEILMMIGKHVEEPELKQLSLTSRQLHPVFNLLLYKSAQETKPSAHDADNLLDPGIVRAAEKGIVGAVRKFIDTGSDVNVHHSQYHITALHMAADHDHVQVVELLLDNGADKMLAKYGDLPEPGLIFGRELTDDIIELILRFKPKVEYLLDSTDEWSDFDKVYARTLRKYAIPELVKLQSWDGDASLIILSAVLDEDLDDLVAVIEWQKKANPAWRLEDANALYLAILAGNLKLVQTLVAALTNPDRLDDDALYTALFLALKTRDIEIAQYLIDQGVPLNIPKNEAARAVPPVFGAAASSDLEVLDFVLGLGANILETAPSFGTMLHYAAGKQGPVLSDLVDYWMPEIPFPRVRMLRRLLELGADVNPEVPDTPTPLTVAVRVKDLEAIEFLLDHGAKAHDPDQRVITALEAAIRADFVPATKLLLRHGMPDKSESMQPLNIVAVTSYHSVEMLKLLLDAGADIHAEDSDGHTPLINAVTARHHDKLDKIRILLEYGAPINQPGGCRGAALTHAISPPDIEATKLLLDYGADIHMFTPDGQNCLHDAIKGRNIPILKLLLECGADITRPTQQGLPPLHLAITTNDPQIVATLLEAKAPVNELAREKGTPLTFALQPNLCNMSIITLLLEHGACPNIRSRKGTSALHLAVMAGHEDAAALLLKHGADVNAQDRKGLTPLMRAAALHGETRKWMQTLLEQHGADSKLSSEEVNCG